MLAHEIQVGAAPAERWMIFLHGILGRRANWRSFARRWLDRMPGWGAVLVDLRLHGDSQAIAGPHGVVSAAADVVELVGAIEALHGGRVAALLGHSFGGKVGILVADRLRGQGRSLERLWVIDAPPGPRTQPRDRTTERVFERLASLPDSFAERREFVEAIVEAGIARSVAQWLATNLAETAVEHVTRWRFALDLPALRTMLDDFMIVDAWPALERVSDAGTEVELVLGGDSQAVFGEQRLRAERMAQAGMIELIEIPGASHWVHVDRPNELLARLAR
ncbi:alpha/beta fold hydrolase [Nannocystaceae bacterium ST9]